MNGIQDGINAAQRNESQTQTTTTVVTFDHQLFQTVMMGGIGMLLIVIAFTLVSINGKLKDKSQN